MIWETAPLGEVAQLIGGGTPSKARSEYWGKGIPWITSADIANDGAIVERAQITPLGLANNPGNVVPPNSVVLVTRTGVGKTAITDRPLAFSQDIVAFAAHPRLNPDYLRQFLRLSSPALKRKSRGATILGVTREDVLSLRIPLPPLPEQRRIAAILDEADALRSQASAAKASAADLMRAKGNAPVGQSIPLGHCVTISSGKSVVGSEDSDSSARVLKISAVTSGVFLEAESKPLPSGYEPPPAHLVHAGDLLVSRANTAELVGASAFVYDEPSRPVALPDKLWRLTVDRALADPAFLHSEISSATFRAKVSRRATGSGGSMKNIGQSQFLSIPVCLPPLEWQRQFATRASKIRTVQTRLAARAQELDALFASLQNRAFRGEL